MTLIAVFGASGFVGSAVTGAAERSGHTVLRLAAPRLTRETNLAATRQTIAAALEGVEVVVNCAGNPDASAVDMADLAFPNAVLPGVIGDAARMAGIPRYVHVSSAVVQGRRTVLDSSDHVDGFSSYAQSKIGGEHAARSHGPPQTTVYRPPSVHGPTRRVTRQLTAIARSPVATVVAPGDRPSPQTHIDDVASAIVFLCTSAATPPPIVHHPWQGHTTGGLLRMLADGRPPRELPAFLASHVTRVAAFAGHLSPKIAPYARRLEMVWLGQAQAPSWLSNQGWRATTEEKDWIQLGRDARAGADNSCEEAHGAGR